MKLGTILLLAIAIVILRPEIHMPAVTQFVDGTGPIFGGKLFPFVFITIACGAISGFHGLVASGTTSKQLDKVGIESEEDQKIGEHATASAVAGCSVNTGLTNAAAEAVQLSAIAIEVIAPPGRYPAALW